uniref:Metallo-beta-lactamase domain-containing protein n=1 Tax=Anas platyrhynchos platyrhynchos TaxID=8840 RepID=A0A493TVJ6_ANAPP
MLGRALNPCQPPLAVRGFLGCLSSPWAPSLQNGVGVGSILCCAGCWVLRERLRGVGCGVCGVGVGCVGCVVLGARHLLPSPPAAPGPFQLLEIVRREEVVLRAVLTTHHHWDHARGNEELARLCPGLRVYGADERIGALTHKVAPNEELTVRVPCARGCLWVCGPRGASSPPATPR